jgi:hypothetical protein
MPVAWGPVRGRVVFDSSGLLLWEQATSGFSIVGSRTMLVTDLPAVYVHDTGGFGAPFVAALEPATDPEFTLELTDRSTRLAADITLPAGRSIRVAAATPLAPEALAVLTNLAGKLLPDASACAFVSPCAVSVTPCYEPDPDATAPPARDPAAASSPVRPAELAAYVVVKGGRLELRARGKVIVDWPVNRITAAPTDSATVELRGGAVLDGRFLTGAALHLVTEPVRRAFLAALGAVRPEAAATGTSAPVSVRGLEGTAGRSRVDCVLGETVLELQARDSAAVLASFELDDPQLRVAGSAERFVIFHPAHGAVTVCSDSEVFGQRLHAHPGLRAAAERTLATGPFPAELADGRPVALAVTADAIRVKGATVDLRIPFAAISGVEGQSGAPRASLRVAAERSEVTITGQLELVQAVHTEAAAGSYATAEAAQVPDLLRAAVGLEEDYFLYTVFGPFYEMHAALLGDADAAGLGAGATPPDSEEDRTRSAALLAEGLAELQRHLDRVSFVLPAFVRDRDAQLIAPFVTGEPAWLKVQEGQLRQAIVPVQRIAGETAQLAAQVGRVLDLDPAALPKTSYAGAAVSLGAAALLNPVFAVAGATQAYRQYSQGEKRKAQVSAQSARGWGVVLDRWNTLVRESVPVGGYVLTENVFGLRWEAAQQITKALRDCPADRRGAALRAVARRLARLDVMRRYPASAGIRLRRGEITDHMRTARDAVATPRFADF